MCVCERVCVLLKEQGFFNDTSRCSHDEWGREGMRERGAEEEYKKGYFREHYEEEGTKTGQERRGGEKKSRRTGAQRKSGRRLKINSCFVLIQTSPGSIEGIKRTSLTLAANDTLRVCVSVML